MIDSKHVLKKIIKIVVSVHLLLVMLAFIEIKRKPKKIWVTSKVMRENFRSVKPPSKPTIPLQKSMAKPKAVVAQAKAAKKNVAKSSPTAKKITPKKEPIAIETRANIPPPKTNELSLPKAIAQLDIEKNPLLEEGDFIEESSKPYLHYFTNIIQNRMQLKPNAFVHLEITINSEGKVLKVLHKKSSDSFHKDYIIENVKQMQFLPFFGEIARDSEYTFVLTLEGES